MYIFTAPCCINNKQIPLSITALLIVLFSFQAIAKPQSGLISTRQDAIGLTQALSIIEKQSGYFIWYKSDLINPAVKISLQLDKATLEQALEQVLKNQNLTYVIYQNTVTIQKKTEVLQSAPPQEQTIQGTVTDEKGEPLEGATVKVKGGFISTLTDSKGSFILKNVPENTTLVISYVGYNDKELAVFPGQKNVLAVLTSNQSTLDQVQVIAYGTTTQRYSTGNIATVSAKELERQPVNNPLLALTARVPGLFISQSTGMPGSGVSVRIQGTNSISSGNDPFYVIDGVPFVSQMLPTISSVLGSSDGAKANGVNAIGSGNPLQYLNPGDIESITILKDADATAIYGSRAANGAILITTKKGKAGDTRVNLTLQNGWGKVGRKIDLMNTQQYLEMRKEAKRNDNAAIASTDYDINGFWDTTRYTDWQKEMIGGTAKYQDGQLSFSGGNNSTQYLIGSGYHRETSVFPTDYNDTKASVHFNITNSSNNQKFRIQLTGSYLYDINNLSSADLTSNIYLAPTAPALYNADGSLNWQPTSGGGSSWTNPLASSLNTLQMKGGNLLANAILGYKILSNLEIKTSLGYNIFTVDELTKTPIGTFAPENRGTATRSAGYAYSAIKSWIAEPQISYNKYIGGGRLEVLAGATFNERKSDRRSQSARGFTSDLLMDNPNAAPTTSIGSSLQSIYTYNSAFARFTYNYAEKYILNLTGRRDGSSRFGSKNRYHNFGAIGAAWLISETQFVKQNLKWLSYAKIRGSYGTTGNDQIGDYNFLNLYSPLSGSASYQNITSFTTTGIPNPYIQWEETRKLQFGLDLTLFKNRLEVTTNYFRNRSSNQLLYYPLPRSSGVTSILTNLPANVQNKGWEVLVNSTNIRSKTFEWTSSFNLTVSRNKLVSFPGIEKSTYSSMAVGQPISIKKVPRFGGVDPETGTYIIMDASELPTSSPNLTKDLTVYLDLNPKYFVGFQNTVTYKSFQLDFLFQGVKKLSANMLFGRSLFAGSFNTNTNTSLLARWKKPGDVTTIARYSVTQAHNIYASISNAAYSDGSYIRLKNVSISYQLPNKLLKRAHIRNLRVFTQGQNLFTITRYDGLDPESQGNASLPPLRVITIGIQAGL